NREVKPRSADDTALSCGKVGRRRPYSGSLSIALGLFCFHASPSPRRDAKRMRSPAFSCFHYLSVPGILAQRRKGTRSIYEAIGVIKSVGCWILKDIIGSSPTLCVRDCSGILCERSDSGGKQRYSGKPDGGDGTPKEIDN
ncbi:MAG: hypothetical protein IKW51_02290, partial [Bacteroidales bacterium]|nr:hypothetical protein [Bacteroidales bacterium]